MTQQSQSQLLGLELVETPGDGGPSSSGTEAAVRSPLDSMLAPGLVAFGVALAVFLMLRVARRNWKRARSTEAPAQRIAGLREDAQRRAVLENSMADAVELTQKLAATLDNKAASLRALMDEADRRIAALRGVGGATQFNQETQISSQPTPSARDVSMRVESMRQEPRIVDGSRTDRDERTIDPLHARVADMARDGATTIQIAKQLGKPIGQIELILALNRPA